MERREASLLRFVLMASMVALCMAQQDWNQRCGPVCKCNWASGKKTAKCIRQNFVPTHLSSEIQILDLTGNHITYLPHEAFSTVNLVNLQKLVLRECQMESIDTDAFYGLKIVLEIDLSCNKIKRIFPGTFVETQRLRILHLNDNSLEFLEDGLFQDLIYLHKVVLSDNRLAQIGENTFRNLPGLQILTLGGNNLTGVRLSTFEDLPKLSSLELRNNPWNCNCHLKRFRDWTINRGLYATPTGCSQPENLAGKMWDEISSDDFNCRPKILVGPHVELQEGEGDVKLWCRTYGTPRPQLSWIHRVKILNNSTKRHNWDRSYVLIEENEWLNLTISNASPADIGDYICMATSPGGSIERNVSLTIVGDNAGRTITVSLPLALGVVITFLLLLLITFMGFVWYSQKARARHQKKSTEEGSLEHNGLGEQGKSFIAALNPAKPSVTSDGLYTADLNSRTLLNSGSVFANGPRVIAVITGDEERQLSSTDLNKHRVTRGASFRQFSPNPLAFPGGRRASLTNQTSTAPHHSRFTNPQQAEEHQQPGPFRSRAGRYSAAFRTLPRNLPGGAASSHYDSELAAMLRRGYVTMPRKPRIPSWGPPTSSAQGPAEGLEPIYDNLGLRTTADGSSLLSLNKNPEPGPVSIMRGRPLPRTPTGNPYYNTIPRSTPNIVTSTPLDRSAPEGAPGWPARLPDEINKRIMQPRNSINFRRKLPPRPPPKPEKWLPRGPLCEDEDDDGTEV